MQKKDLNPLRSFTPYYHNNSLLIQMMIVEMAHVHSCFKYFNDFDSNFTNLKEILQKLIGYHTFKNSSCSINHHTGHLNLLKNLSHHFLSNLHQQNHHVLIFHKLVDHTWLCGVQILQLLNRIDSNQLIKDEEIKQNVVTLFNYIEKLTKTIKPLIYLFQNDENVIFFLIRKKSQLIDLFGGKSYKKLLKEIISQNNLNSFLINKFKENGFYNIIPFAFYEISHCESFLNG